MNVGCALLQSLVYAKVCGAIVTPGITAHEYWTRRTRLASKLPKGAVAVVAAADIKFRSPPAVFYEFHQDSNFFYLTGFNEPDALAVISKSADTDEDHVFHLYVREKDPKEEQWEGMRSGTQAAEDVFNADQTGDIVDVDQLLSPIISDASTVYTDLFSTSKTQSFFSRLLKGKSTKTEGLAQLLGSSQKAPLKDIIYEMRNTKSDAEVANMRTAGQASGRAFTEAMRHQWHEEKNLAAFFDYKFKRNGCDASAYLPVVAGGRNAGIIHYVANNGLLSPKDFVLVDAGGEYGGYITDITRTWPVSGTFTPAQKDLYNAVLIAQRHCVSLCRVNASLSLDQIHEACKASLKDSLSQLGFDTSAKALETLFPHHIGHYIGLDVHDTGGYPRHTRLKARQCVTIEPGVYVPDMDMYPIHFRGMGLRIEDSVCVQEEHPLVLTTEAVREVRSVISLVERKL